MRGHRDLALISLLAAICAVSAALLPLEALRAVFAVPLCLVLPGYALTAANFARHPLPGAQIALLSVALSLCVLALGSLVLNYVGGLHAGTWAIFLMLFTVALSRLAAIRRPPRHESPPGFFRLTGLPPMRAVMLGIGLVAAVAAVALAFVALPAKNAIGHTEIWISTAGNSQGAVVKVGVGSQEQHAASYFLRVRVGRDPQPLIRLFNLVPGERRLIRVGVPAPALRTPVTASLFRQSDPERLYRRVYTWLPGAAR